MSDQECKAERREQVCGYPFLVVSCPQCGRPNHVGVPEDNAVAKRRCTGCGEMIVFVEEK
jgi:hypothetical protein